MTLIDVLFCDTGWRTFIQWCLIHAAAGGVGMVAVHLAKALGAKVIATAGSEAKLKVCKDNGADYVLDYTDPKWPNKVKEITGGKGVDVIYDPVGMILPSLKCIAWNGRAVVVGFAAGSIEKVKRDRLLVNLTAELTPLVHLDPDESCAAEEY